MRQQMEMHRPTNRAPRCHKIMDPIGFSLENFDAVGHWRVTDDGSPIDPSGMLVDGTKLDGVTGLRDALVRYSPQFVRVITEKLMIYALGRGTEYFDMPADPLHRARCRRRTTTSFRRWCWEWSRASRSR